MKQEIKTTAHGAAAGEGSTKERILGVAERMIASRGLQQFSIRDISGEAGVNLAAINYHFGSKERLIAEVLARRVTVLNEERMAQLDRLEAGPGGRAIGVEAIMEVIINTMLHTDARERTHSTLTTKMLSRFFLEPDEEIARMLKPHFQPFKERVVKLFAQTLPHLKRDDIEWRSQQIFGLLGHHMLFAEMRCRDLGKDLNIKKEQRRLLTFCCAAMKAPLEAA